MLRINLHLHSTCSDGVYSPAELVRLLSLNRVSVAALTDHDTVEGVPAFLAACRKRDVRGVSGVELASRYDNGDELHILGYRFELADPGLKNALKTYREGRRARNAAVCERLAALGIPVSLKDAEVLAGPHVVGRPHIAQLLVDRGYAATIKEAFLRYLGQGAAAFVPRELPATEKMIGLIRQAGGLPVWAHPLASLSDPELFTAVLGRLKEAGLWGVECWFHRASSQQIFFCLSEAGKRGLYATAGTDFHGRAGHSAKISGCMVRDDLLPWARFCGGL